MIFKFITLIITNGQTLWFGQLGEQLSAYYTTWQAQIDTKLTYSMTKATRRPVQAQVCNHDRAIPAPPVPSNNLIEPVPTQGLLPLTRIATTRPGLSNLGAMGRMASMSQGALLDSRSHHGLPDARGPVEQQAASQPTPSLSSTMPVAELSSLALQHTKPMGNWDQWEQIARMHIIASLDTPQAQKRPWKRQTCRRCALPDCHGSKSIEECHNSCQDCCCVHQCKGRNPARSPKTPCWDAWD